MEPGPQGFIGLALGTFAPGYYRTVFRYGDSPDFNSVHVGVAAGLAVGCVVVLAVTWYDVRRLAITGGFPLPLLDDDSD